MSKEKTITFKGTIIRNVFDSQSFKIYAVNVDKHQYPNVKFNKFKNASICGELPELTEGVEYEVAAIEELTPKYGYSYRVKHIKRDVPANEYDSYVFLCEVLSESQAKALLDAYPDIIQRIINGNADSIDLSKIYGVGEKRFEVIKNKVIENFKLVDLVSEFKGVLSLSIIRKIYEEYSSIDVLRDKLKSEPYTSLTRISGIGFKTADSIIMELQKENIVDFGYDVKTSQDRCLSCVMYLLQENENEGNTKMNLADLRRACIQLVPACSDHFTDVIKSSDIYYNKDTMDIAIAKTHSVETKIAKTIVDNLVNENNIWDFDVEKYRNVGEFELSDDQIMTLHNVCKNNICILNGFAGSGKSASTKALINMLEDNGKTYKIFAPTGKASKVIAEFTGRPASTIHRGLGYVPPNVWTFNSLNKLNEDIVIIDEFSMVDVWLFARVIDAIDFDTTKLLMIGDNAQLCSVGCGNLLHDFMETNLIPTVTLTKIFRYADGGLMKVATDVRCGRSYLDNSMKSQATTFGSNKDYMFVDSASDLIPKQAVALYKKLLDNGHSVNDIQVLTAKNIHECGAIELNNMLQRVANKNYGSKDCMKVGETTYYAGDLILQKLNNYEAELAYEDGTAFVANGETGLIESFDKGYAIIDFDGVKVKYGYSDMSMVNLGYAMSIHKSQGSGIDNVIICSPQSHTFMLNSNLLYVALTRAKKKCYHLGGLSTINRAIHKKENMQRHTFMKDLLIDMHNQKSQL